MDKDSSTENELHYVRPDLTKKKSSFAKKRPLSPEAQAALDLRKAALKEKAKAARRKAYEQVKAKQKDQRQKLKEQKARERVAERNERDETLWRALGRGSNEDMGRAKEAGNHPTDDAVSTTTNANEVQSIERSGRPRLRLVTDSSTEP